MRGYATALSLMLFAGALARADGRTDGPENSEFGKGGYSKPSGGRFSLAADFGANLFLGGPAAGAPLYAGGTASFWVSDWFLFDATGTYAFNGGQVNALVGPRFRTASYPVSFAAGLRAGVIHRPTVGLRFGLSPVVGAELLFNRHLVAGLHAALDWPLGGDGVSTRIGLNVGWRF